VRALARWEALQVFNQRAEQDRQRQASQQRISAFQSNAAKLFPEGEPTGLQAFVAKGAESLHVAAQEVIAEAEIGPKVADYLGSNPRELNRISALPPAQQVREVTLLEIRLSAPPKPTPKTATEAPEPPPQARGAGGRFSVAPDTDDFAAFDKTYGV
jgi:hypothetical protein